jgi:hypothetical protein
MQSGANAKQMLLKLLQRFAAASAAQIARRALLKLCKPVLNPTKKVKVRCSHSACW